VVDTPLPISNPSGMSTGIQSRGGGMDLDIVTVETSQSGWNHDPYGGCSIEAHPAGENCEMRTELTRSSVSAPD
jgi:hypothetical protein